MAIVTDLVEDKEEEAAGTTTPVAERFEIIQLLGRGGMGEVYKAWDRELEAHVALKALLPEAALDPTMLERFRREVKLARRVKHVNVGQVHDLVTQDGVRYLSMEYLEGQDLSILTKGRRLPLHVALGLLAQVCRGLQAAHDVGVVHRDLKPHNIIVTRKRGCAVIVDFGIAREVEDVDDGLTRAGIILGSPQYLSYEQLCGRTATAASDIYSLGILLSELVTGVSPFRVPGASAAALRALREVPPDPRTLEPRLPAFVSVAVKRCLERHPEDRFASAMELLAFLDSHNPGLVGPSRDSAANDASPAASGTLEELGQAAPPRVLLATSDAEEGTALKQRLENLGCTVDLVGDGLAAVEATLAEQHALVVMATDLDQMDGMTAWQVIGRNPKNEETEFLCIVGQDDTGREAYARELGAIDVVRRPVNVHALTRVVRRALS